MASVKGTVVIKLGTSSLIREDVRKLNITCLASICETVSKLRAAGASAQSAEAVAAAESRLHQLSRQRQCRVPGGACVQWRGGSRRAQLGPAAAACSAGSEAGPGSYRPDLPHALLAGLL